jgi:hypothetical protein
MTDIYIYIYIYSIYINKFYTIDSKIYEIVYTEYLIYE